MRISPAAAGAHASALPALWVAVLPKCPACVMLVFGALGVEHMLHRTAFFLLQAAMVLAVVGRLAARSRAGARAPLAAGTVGGCLTLLASAGVAPHPAGYAGAAILAGAWLTRASGRSAPACGCAPATPAGPSRAAPAAS